MSSGTRYLKLRDLTFLPPQRLRSLALVVRPGLGREHCEAVPEHVRPRALLYGYTLLVCLILNMLLQLLIVWAQTTKGPKATMVKDMLYVVSAVKPGVDAWRVATGLDQNEY